jgi:peptidoglycan/xylan/chitin deacetylase (PgdA/CDA1 family)
MGSHVNVCFHGIGEPRRQLEPGEGGYWVDVARFQTILDVVVENPWVEISFDDGNVSDFEHGLPALTERGLRATFFVLAGRLGTPGSLSCDQTRALVTEGMSVGTHGMDHVPWVGLDERGRRRELVEARDRLEEVTGRTVDQAALPLGRYDRRVLAHLRAVGYRHVHTSDRAWAREGAWLQPRFSILSSDTVDTVRRHILTRPSWGRRAERTAARMVKRLR